jgi:membrane protein
MLSARFFRFFRYLNLATLKKTFARAMKRRLMGLSAEMAYNAILALFPAILAILTAIGLFEDSLQSTFHNLVGQLSEVAPDAVVELIRQFKAEITRTKSTSLFSFSFILAIWASSGAMSAAMNAFDQMRKIPPEQARPFWKAKLVSLGLTIGSILISVLACFLVFISDWLIKMVVAQSGASVLLTIWRLLSWPLALGIIATGCAFIYRYGPSRWTPGTPIMPGAVLAAIAWAIVSALFRLYVANFGNYNKVYGAVGAVIVLLLWLYMTSLVLLLGEQLNTTVGEAMQQAKMRNRFIKATKAKE